MGNLKQLAQQKASELRRAGRGEDALLVLEHAIHRLPEDLDLLNAYADLARVLIEETGLDDAEARLDALNAFVRSRAVHVDFDKIDDVLRFAAKARRPSDAARTTAAPRPRVEDHGDVLHDLRVGKLDLTAPEEEPALAARLRDLEDARLALEDAGSAAIELRTVDEALAAARIAADFDAAATEARALLDRARSVSNPARGAYLLQQAEVVLRPFVLDAEKLSPKRVERADQLLAELREVSDAAAQRTRDADADARWTTFKSEYKDRIREIKSWTPPSTAYTDGACNALLEKARQVGQALQELMPSLVQASVAPKVNGVAGELGKIVTRISDEQQSRYNRWALERIEWGFKAGDEHIGVIDDEAKLGESIVQNFGPIDVRLLSHEVQRCYNEVFEHLFQHLDSPDDAEDFEKKGKKLYVLKAMMKTPKTSLADF